MFFHFYRYLEYLQWNILFTSIRLFFKDSFLELFFSSLIHKTIFIACFFSNNSQFCIEILKEYDKIMKKSFDLDLYPKCTSLL